MILVVWELLRCFFCRAPAVASSEIPSIAAFFVAGVGGLTTPSRVQVVLCILFECIFNFLLVIYLCLGLLCGGRLAVASELRTPWPEARPCTCRM